MPTQERTPEKLAVGCLVRVKRGVTASDNPDMPIGGWLGTVSQASGAMRLVSWSGATLEAIPPAYRQRYERDGTDLRATWLQDTDLEGDPGDPLCIEQA